MFLIFNICYNIQSSVHVLINLKKNFKNLKKNSWRKIYNLEVELKQRMWMYDLDNLAADIGGFMGLLLGASIYTFADLLVTAIEKMIMKK